MNKRAPFRALRFANQAHVRFLRKPITLAGIAWNTGTNHIFPSGRSAAVARHHVIEIQIVPVKKVAAVLAGIFVPLKNIMAGELYFFLWKPIKKQKHNDAWHTNLPRNRRDQLVVGCGGGNLAPAVEIVRQEIICRVGRNDVGVAGVNERERASRRADVYRLPQTV